VSSVERPAHVSAWVLVVSKRSARSVHLRTPGIGRASVDYAPIAAERDPKGVTLHPRRGYDFADRFPPDQGRGAADCCQYRQAAGVAAAVRRSRRRKQLEKLNFQDFQFEIQVRGGKDVARYLARTAIGATSASP
jgi:hypothetical protein